MISTLFLLLFLAFQLWYLTSPQVRMPTESYPAVIATRPRPARVVGALLAGLSALLFGLHWGWMTGLCSWLVGLMGVGSLVVTLGPFRYLTPYATLGLYAACLGFELLF